MSNAIEIAEDVVGKIHPINISQFLGPWAIEEGHFDQLYQTFQNFDWYQHLNFANGFIVPSQRSDAGAYPVRNGVAVISINGPMSKHGSSMSDEGSTVSARKKIANITKDPEVKGAFFNWSTPGGTVAGNAELAADIHKLSQSMPTVSYCEDLCASAGIWNAVQAKKVYANQPHSMIGSIGTFVVLHDMSKLAEEKGIKVHVVKSGDFKGSGTPGTPITEEHLAHYQTLINEMQKSFSQGVASGRGVTLDVVATWADGRVHSAEKALGMGLIDGIKSADEALDELVQQVSTKRQFSMSEQPTEPKAATLSELKASCPGASSEFLVEQLERKATVTQATSAMIAHQQEQIVASEKDKTDAVAAAVAEAEEKAKSDLAKQAGQGVDPLTEENVDDQSCDGDVVQKYETLVGKMVAAGSDRRKACSAVAKSNPKLHQAWLVAVNQHSSSASRLAKEKIEQATS